MAMTHGRLTKEKHGAIDFVTFAAVMREQLKLFCLRRLGNFIASVQDESGQEAIKMFSTKLLVHEIEKFNEPDGGGGGGQDWMTEKFYGLSAAEAATIRELKASSAAWKTKSLAPLAGEATGCGAVEVGLTCGRQQDVGSGGSAKCAVSPVTEEGISKLLACMQVTQQRVEECRKGVEDCHKDVAFLRGKDFGASRRAVYNSKEIVQLLHGIRHSVEQGVGESQKGFHKCTSEIEGLMARIRIIESELRAARGAPRSSLPSNLDPPVTTTAAATAAAAATDTTATAATMDTADGTCPVNLDPPARRTEYSPLPESLRQTSINKLRARQASAPPSDAATGRHDAPRAVAGVRSYSDGLGREAAGTGHGAHAAPQQLVEHDTVPDLEESDTRMTLCTSAPGIFSTTHAGTNKKDGEIIRAPLRRELQQGQAITRSSALLQAHPERIPLAGGGWEVAATANTAKAEQHAQTSFRVCLRTDHKSGQGTRRVKGGGRRQQGGGGAEEGQPARAASRGDTREGETVEGVIAKGGGGTVLLVTGGDLLWG